MARQKVAVDCDISERMVSVLNTLYEHKGFEFIYVPTFAPHDSTDEFWADAFKKFGGVITLSGDSKIAFKPHKAIAFIDNGFTSFFMDPKWGSLHGHSRAAHLCFWWPVIEAKIAEKVPGTCWRVPCEVTAKSLRLPLNGQLEELRIPNEVLEEARRKKNSG